MKKLIIGLTLLTSLSSFSRVSLSSLVTEITMSVEFDKSTDQDELELYKHLCHELYEKIEKRDFENVSPETAASTLQRNCKRDLPDGVSWKLNY